MTEGTVDRVEPLALFDLPAPDPDPVIAAAPVGELVDTEQGKWGLATATFDTTRTYRYRLSRVWDPTKPRVNFLMLNPSTADAFNLDPTVRRCIGFAHNWDAGALEVTNAYALRSTDPAGLRHVDDPVGVDNDAAIIAAAQAADLVIAAWGPHATYQDREQNVRHLLDEVGVELHTLVLTKHGHPGHPLYIAADTAPVLWHS